MSIQTKYTGKNRQESIVKYKRLVIPRVPIAIIRALRQQSINTGRSVHDDGSAAGEALFYIYEGLLKRNVNVDAILKSTV